MSPGGNAPRFRAGDAVRVRDADVAGHVRTPRYIRGRPGVVERCCGAFRNPEALAYAGPGLPKVALYRVRFRLADVWPDYAGPAHDTLDVEIFEHWLEGPP
ncbi:MAG TPA: SH3-like domain-containing protein [Myxococcota bacterium]|nr:SH3-like domain-containing protein [Myxococcota bacterium]